MKGLLLNDNNGRDPDTILAERNTISTSQDIDIKRNFQLQMSNLVLNESVMKNKDPNNVDNFENDINDKTGDIIKENDFVKHSYNGSWLKAIPFLAYWIVKYIHSDPELTIDGSAEDEMKRVAQAISDNISIEFEECNVGSECKDLGENVNGVTRDVIKINEDVKDSPIERTSTFGNVNDSIHGENVKRDEDFIEHHNFNALSSKPNPCNCKHGGECLPETKTCYCSHGFTGSKCRKRIRKVILVGGLRGHEIRLDSELVAGLEVHRCSPPAFPRPVMAATGQTAGDTVAVCGGATLLGNTSHRLDHFSYIL